MSATIEGESALGSGAGTGARMRGFVCGADCARVTYAAGRATVDECGRWEAAGIVTRYQNAQTVQPSKTVSSPQAKPSHKYETVTFTSPHA